jgi:starch phosphorylase
VPESLGGLKRLAGNLRWTWNEPTQELFSRTAPALWDSTGHDPIHLLEAIPPARWQELAADRDFVSAVEACRADLDRALTEPRWFQTRNGSSLRLVAYFSPEFGISETLPQYSGGLGVLAGDHLKASSDLGIPLVAVGLLYREGYFRQRLNAAGWQEEWFPRMDPASSALTDTGVRIGVDLEADHLTVAVWRVDVGRIPLYLLDTDVDGNSPGARLVTDRLYGGDTEHRLRQEIVLGIGGVRALRALGLDPQVFHTNEGHAGFLALERIREHVASGLTFAESIEAVRAGGLFTTHTPVPAGIDRYTPDLMARYFGSYVQQLGCSFDDLMALGRSSDEPEGPRFNMAVMGLRLSARSNAVAKLHGEVSRQMFHHLWPGALESEVPVTSVTNGVHAKTWTSSNIDALLSVAVGPAWDGADAATWAGIEDLDGAAIWSAKRRGRDSLVRFVRNRMHADLLDADVLTIGFARRFATYKRATLLLSQPERLKAMLLHPQRPVQFVFAGKAHPADNPGKEMIQQIEHFARELDIAHRFVFVPDYDIAIARAMYRGCDVWLNNPRRPLEACGTSGMKAALNGALNCSIKDGWWDECADGMNGWAITSADEDADAARRDEREAANLFNLLEGEVAPMFYDGVPPSGWIARMKHAWATLGPFVTASRMVRDYTQCLYEPAASAASKIAADGFTQAKELAEWKRRIADLWSGVRVVSFDEHDAHVTVTVDLGRLEASDVSCEVVHGSVDPEGTLLAPKIEPLQLTGVTDSLATFEGPFHLVTAGPYGVTARVRAEHPLLASPVEAGHITWASA